MEWRDIQGYEGIYQVSSHGHVKRLAVKDSRGHLRNEKFLKLTLNKRGYLVVGLTLYNQETKFLVHRLVAETFIENPNQLTNVCHIDNDLLNNNASNLVWKNHDDIMKEIDWSKRTMPQRKQNDYEVNGKEVIVKLTNSSKTMTCDIDDWDRLKTHCWHLDQNGYVSASINGKLKLFHIQIIECPKNMVRDHINRNRLDNRKSNLRVATYHQNSINSKISSKNKSEYKGISFNGKRNKWHARLTCKGVFHDLGCFDDINDAIKARRNAEIKYFAY